MKKKNLTKKIMFWMPRGIGILNAVVISLLLIDPLKGGMGFEETVFSLFIRFIPLLAILIALDIVWYWEKTGGIVFIILSMLFTLFFNSYQNFTSFISISLLPLLSGIFFILGYIYKSKKLKFINPMYFRI